MTIIRSATAGDAAAWLRMREALWPDDQGSHAGEVQQFFAGTLREPVAVLLGFDTDGAAVGFAELSIRNVAEDCVTDRVAFLEGWYVDAHARRRGVGRALVAAAEQWALAQGCVEFASDALIDNEVSLAAHLALGFEETERIRCFKKVLAPLTAARSAATVETRKMLRHFLAALAYRTQKALRGAPADFGSFLAGQDIRTPAQLVRHMTSVLGYARTFIIGGHYRPEPLPSLPAEIDRFHEVVRELAQHLESAAPFLDPMTPERMLQGPFADAMTHAGQLAMLRRLAGSPVPPENFIFAEIDVARLGPDQAEPARPDPAWPEAPAGWMPPSRT
jgi:GNAT superfamily N-acetyltransferase